MTTQKLWWCPVEETWQPYECGDGEHGDEDDTHPEGSPPDEPFLALPRDAMKAALGALAFYSAPALWDPYKSHEQGIDSDNGERARAAISKIEL